MANVLCVYENRIATVNALEDLFVETQSLYRNFSYKFVSISKLSEKMLYKYDVLMIIRPNNLYFAKLAHMAAQNNIFVIFYTDDDLMNLPSALPSIPWRLLGMKESAKNADVIISPNKKLCDKYLSLSKTNRAFVLNTPVSIYDIMIRNSDSTTSPFKIVYAASLAHASLFENNIKPILKKLDEKYGDMISFTFMGVHPKLETNYYHFPIKYIEPLPLHDYRKKIESEKFDIGLAPLNTDNFSKYKYFNKFIEYAMFGIVGVFTNTEPYTFVVNDGENGFLVNNNPNEWFDVLCKVIDDPNRLKTCRENAYKTLYERFEAKTIIVDLLNNVPELNAKKTVNIKTTIHIRFYIYRCIYFISRFGDWIYKSVFYLKSGGLISLINRIKIHFSIARNISKE